MHRALAQPRLVGGVAVWFFLTNLGVAAEAFLLTGSLLSLPIALATHVGRALARLREPGTLARWLTRTGRLRQSSEPTS